jgi:glycine/D-amino acid oxidase-like deaminating enzyme
VPKAFCIGARQRGTRIFEGVCVSEVLRSADGTRAIGVMTNRGRLDADIVVLTGGMWTRELAKTCGVKVPLYPVEHHYVVTKPLPGARDDLPVGRDPDLMIYFRGEGDGIMLGASREENLLLIILLRLQLNLSSHYITSNIVHPFISLPSITPTTMRFQKSIYYLLCFAYN